MRCNRLSSCLAATVVLALTGPTAFAQSPKGAAPKGSMDLETQGIFWAGGRIVNRTEPTLAANKTMLGQVYVEYFIPKKLRRGAVPIVMTHTTISSAVFQTNGTGGEGLAQYFVRQGFPVYVVEAPGTGRSGLDIDEVNRAATGQIPPLAKSPVTRGASESWPRWNIGPSLGTVGDGVKQGNLMPTDEENQKRFLAVQLPEYLGPADSATAGVMVEREASFIKVLEKTGPAIYMGWSAGGGLGQRLLVARPDLFKALISFDSYSGQGPTFRCNIRPVNAIVDAVAANKIPFLNVNSQAGHTLDTDNSKSVCRELVDLMKAQKADATLLYLPDLGITGNSHMWFWEPNADKIAALVVDWIDKHVDAKAKPATAAKPKK